MHNLEHGYTILWYDKTVADSDSMMDDLRGIASKFEDNENFRNKFKAVPWTSEDGEPFPGDQHVAMTHWSIGGATETAAGQAGRRLPVLLGPQRRRAGGVHEEVPLHRLPGARRDLTPADLTSGDSWPSSLRAATIALTSCARSRVVTRSASPVSTTTTSRRPTTATIRPPWGTTSPVRVDGPHQPGVTEHGDRVVADEQGLERGEVTDVVPAEGARHHGHPAGGRGRLGHRVVDRDPGQGRPDLGQGRGVGRDAAQGGGEAGVLLAEQVQQHSGPRDEHAGVPPVARVDVRRSDLRRRLLHELRAP